MWGLKDLVTYLVIVGGGTQFMFLGVFGAQFLLAILSPEQSRTFSLWEMLAALHFAAFGGTSLVLLATALLWNIGEYYLLDAAKFLGAAVGPAAKWVWARVGRPAWGQQQRRGGSGYEPIR